MEGKTYSPEELGESCWILLAGLPNRASWNKVRGMAAEISCTVVSGRVKRDKGIAIVKLSSIDEAKKAEKEIQGKTFRDVPGVPISAQRIPESASDSYD